MEEKEKGSIEGMIEQKNEELKAKAEQVEEKVLERRADSKIKIGMFRGIQTRIVVLVFIALILCGGMYMWTGIPLYKEAVMKNAKTPEEIKQAKELVQFFVERNVYASLLIIVL